VPDAIPVRMPPFIQLPRALQTLRFARRPIGFNLCAQRQFGDVWQLRLASRSESFVVTSHPDHVASLLKAKPHEAPSLTGESPLRPILGANSVLTSVGARHLRQRKLLLAPFHGQAVARYTEMIGRVAEREIDAWPIGRQFALAPRVVLTAIARRTDLIAPDPAPEPPRQRNVTMIPRGGCQVFVTGRRDA
jgi:cytochrome P450